MPFRDEDFSSVTTPYFPKGIPKSRIFTTIILLLGWVCKFPRLLLWEIKYSFRYLYSGMFASVLIVSHMLVSVHSLSYPPTSTRFVSGYGKLKMITLDNCGISCNELLHLFNKWFWVLSWSWEYSNEPIRPLMEFTAYL